MSRSASAGRRADVRGATTGAIPAYQRTLAHLTVRARLLTAVVVLSALTVMIAGGTAFALQAAETDERIDNSLSRAVAALASSRPSEDQTTGQPFTSVSDVLQRGRAQPGARQERGRRRAARRRARSGGRRRRRGRSGCEEDAELVAVLAAMPADTPSRAPDRLHVHRRSTA